MSKSKSLEVTPAIPLNRPELKEFSSNDYLSNKLDQVIYINKNTNELDRVIYENKYKLKKHWFDKSK